MRCSPAKPLCACGGRFGGAQIGGQAAKRAREVPPWATGSGEGSARWSFPPEAGLRHGAHPAHEIVVEGSSTMRLTVAIEHHFLRDAGGLLRASPSPIPRA
jgi:hypothetical protein